MCESLAKRIVEALEDFGGQGMASTVDGIEIEKRSIYYQHALGCVMGAKRAKIDFVTSVLSEKIKPT